MMSTPGPGVFNGSASQELKSLKALMTNGVRDHAFKAISAN